MPRPTRKFFDDVPLPLLDGEEFQSTKKIVQPRSETSDVIKYVKYRPAKRANCGDCNTAFGNKERTTISLASYLRIGPEGSVHLCYLHTAERRHQDQMNKLI